MKKFATIALIAGLAGCGGTSMPVETNSVQVANSQPAPITSAGPEVSFASLLNNVRLDNNAGPVSYNGTLDAVAQAHADDMLNQGYFNHQGLDGSNIGDRAKRGGYAYSALAENIASGQQSEAAVMNSWVGSAGHQKNNINPTYTEFGLGYAKNGSDTRWVLMLAAPR